MKLTQELGFSQLNFSIVLKFLKSDLFIGCIFALSKLKQMLQYGATCWTRCLWHLGPTCVADSVGCFVRFVNLWLMCCCVFFCKLLFRDVKHVWEGCYLRRFILLTEEIWLWFDWKSNLESTRIVPAFSGCLLKLRWKLGWIRGSHIKGCYPSLFAYWSSSRIFRVSECCDCEFCVRNFCKPLFKSISYKAWSWWVYCEVNLYFSYLWVFRSLW